MNPGALHQLWRRHGWKLVLVAITVLTLTRAYVMWRHLPGDAAPSRTAI